MPYITDAELVEIVPDLLDAAANETSIEIRAALLRLADRYARMTAKPERSGQAVLVADMAA